MGELDLLLRFETEHHAETRTDLGVVLRELTELRSDRAQLGSDRSVCAVARREHRQPLDDLPELRGQGGVVSGLRGRSSQREKR